MCREWSFIRRIATKMLFLKFLNTRLCSVTVHIVGDGGTESLFCGSFYLYNYMYDKYVYVDNFNCVLAGIGNRVPCR